MSNGEATTGKADKSTLYMRGGLGGMIKIEVRSIEFEEKQYAQYSAAYSIKFVKKGCRRLDGIMQCDFPSALIIAGWDHPEPDGVWGEETPSGPGVSIRRSRYLSNDPRWQEEFDAKIGEYLARTGAKVVLDLRKHNPHRTRARVAA